MKIAILYFLIFFSGFFHLNAIDDDDEDNTNNNSERISRAEIFSLRDSLDALLNFFSNQETAGGRSLAPDDEDITLVDLTNTEEEQIQNLINTQTEQRQERTIATSNRGREDQRTALNSLPPAWPEDSENAITPRRHLNHSMSNLSTNANQRLSARNSLNTSNFSAAQEDFFDIPLDPRLNFMNSSINLRMPFTESLTQRAQFPSPSLLSTEDNHIALFMRGSYSSNSISNSIQSSRNISLLFKNKDAEKIKERKEKRERNAKTKAKKYELEENQDISTKLFAQKILSPIFEIDEEAIETESPRSLSPIQNSDMSLWLRTQLYLQNRALAYQEQQCKITVNLKNDLDLWSILVQRGICKKNEPIKALEWVKNQILANGSGLEGAIGQFNEQLREYETYINLFRDRLNDEENEFNFTIWFSNLPERHDREMNEENLKKWFKTIKKTLMKMPFSERKARDISNETLKQSLHRKWLSALPFNADWQSESPINKAVAQAMHMEIQRYKLIQLEARLDQFYKEQLDTQPPITAENIAHFAIHSIHETDALLQKFMEGRLETNQGVEEHPVNIEDIVQMVNFIQTHHEHVIEYIANFLL